MSENTFIFSLSRNRISISNSTLARTTALAAQTNCISEASPFAAKDGSCSFRTTPLSPVYQFRFIFGASAEEQRHSVLNACGVSKFIAIKQACIVTSVTSTTLIDANQRWRSAITETMAVVGKAETFCHSSFRICVLAVEGMNDGNGLRIATC